jgi:hypothetical protein
MDVPKAENDPSSGPMYQRSGRYLVKRGSAKVCGRDHSYSWNYDRLHLTENVYIRRYFNEV